MTGQVLIFSYQDTTIATNLGFAVVCKIIENYFEGKET